MAVTRKAGQRAMLNGQEVEWDGGQWVAPAAPAAQPPAGLAPLPGFQTPDIGTLRNFGHADPFGVASTFEPRITSASTPEYWKQLGDLQLSGQYPGVQSPEAPAGQEPAGQGAFAADRPMPSSTELDADGNPTRTNINWGPASEEMPEGTPDPAQPPQAKYVLHGSNTGVDDWMNPAIDRLAQQGRSEGLFKGPDGKVRRIVYKGQRTSNPGDPPVVSPAAAGDPGPAPSATPAPTQPLVAPQQSYASAQTTPQTTEQTVDSGKSRLEMALENIGPVTWQDQEAYRAATRGATFLGGKDSHDGRRKMNALDSLWGEQDASATPSPVINAQTKDLWMRTQRPNWEQDNPLTNQVVINYGNSGTDANALASAAAVNEKLPYDPAQAFSDGLGVTRKGKPGNTIPLGLLQPDQLPPLRGSGVRMTQPTWGPGGYGQVGR